MKFRRLIALALCFAMILSIVLFHTAAQSLWVLSLMGSAVTVEVAEDLWREFPIPGQNFTTTDWVEFFVRNLLVGSDADKITKVVLRRSCPRKKRYKSFVFCPLRGSFGATVSESGDELIVVCPSVSSTFCDKWYLNETGLTLFGR